MFDGYIALMPNPSGLLSRVAAKNWLHKLDGHWLIKPDVLLNEKKQSDKWYAEYLRITRILDSKVNEHLLLSYGF